MSTITAFAETKDDHFTVGVLGGMGPEASAEFCRLVATSTPADRDQDHLRLALWSNPQIADRTAHLAGLGPSPLPELLRGLGQLLEFGASVVVMPCNTAHAYLSSLRLLSGAPLLDMVSATAQRCRDLNPAGARVGVLATTGTVLAGVYATALERQGLQPLVPAPADQELVMRAIRLVKAGDPHTEARGLLLRQVEGLIARGSTTVVLGCTEIPLALRNVHLGVRIVDPMAVAAETVVEMSRPHLDSAVASMA